MRALAHIPLLLLDQQERWQRGECPLAESYLEKHPSLRDQLDQVLTLIYHEIVLRERRGWWTAMSAGDRAFAAVLFAAPQAALAAWTWHYWGNLAGPLALEGSLFSRDAALPSRPCPVLWLWR